MGMETEATPTVTEPAAGAPAPADNYADFSAVFDSLVDKGTPDETTPVKTDPPDGAAGAAADDQQQAQSPNGADGAGEPAKPGSDAPPADGAGPQGGAGDDATGGKPQHTDDVNAQIVALQEQIARLTEAAKAPPAVTPPAEDKPVQIYTPEEQTELQALQKEWPDLARMVALMTRQVQHDTLTYAFKEVERVLTPLQTSVGTLTLSDHEAAIYAAHEDYDQVYQPVMEWIEKQPSFLKAAYQNVVAKGTAQDVCDMVTRFKTETKWVAPKAATPPAAAAPAAPAAAPAANQKPAELSDAAKKAATVIGAVGTKRSGGMTAQDPLDFDAAWEELTAVK